MGERERQRAYSGSWNRHTLELIDGKGMKIAGAQCGAQNTAHVGPFDRRGTQARRICMADHGEGDRNHAK
jgi:hypothetical protein